MSFIFNKKMRISSSQEIAALVGEGKSLSLYPIKLFYLKRADASFSRMAVSVPKKSFKRAVDRNLLKRRTREAYRLLRPGFDEKGDFYDLFIIYIAKEIEDYDRIEKSIGTLLAKIR